MENSIDKIVDGSINVDGVEIKYELRDVNFKVDDNGKIFIGYDFHVDEIPEHLSEKFEDLLAMRLKDNIRDFIKQQVEEYKWLDDKQKRGDYTEPTYT